MYPLINDMGRHLRLQPIYPCFSDNMVFMGYQLPEGRKPGR